MAYQPNAHLDQFLSNVSRAYVPQGYVCEQLLTETPTAQYTGKLLVLGKDHLRIEHNVTGEGQEYPYIETNTYSSDSYDIKDYGLQTLVTAKMKRNYTRPADAKRDSAMKLLTIMWLAKENAVAANVKNAANYASSNKVTLAGNDQLSDYTNSDPLDVFGDARKAVRNACGMPPDTATMDWDVFETLRYHPKLLENSKYTKDATGGLSEDGLARSLGVRRLLIAEPVYNSAKQGQTDSLTSLWGKDIIFSVSPQSGSLMQQCFGYNVVLDNRPRKTVRAMPHDYKPEDERLFIDDNYDMLMDFTCGYLVKDAIA